MHRLAAALKQAHERLRAAGLRNERRALRVECEVLERARGRLLRRRSEGAQKALRRRSEGAQKVLRRRSEGAQKVLRRCSEGAQAALQQRSEDSLRGLIQRTHQTNQEGPHLTGEMTGDDGRRWRRGEMMGDERRRSHLAGEVPIESNQPSRPESAEIAWRSHLGRLVAQGQQLDEGGGGGGVEHRASACGVKCD